MTTSDDIVAQVQKIKADFAAVARDIQSHGYQPDIEKGHLASEYILASRKIADLRKEYDDARRRERTDHAQRAFSVDDLTSADPMTRMVSYRDAQDRAEAAKGNGALSKLLARAISTNDAVLARACAVHAFNTGQREVVDQYDDHVPGWSELAQQARENQRNESLAATIRFRLPKPIPIGTLSERDMQNLVESTLQKVTEKSPGRTMVEKSQDMFWASMERNRQARERNW